MKKAYVKPQAIKSALLSQVVAAASVVQSKTAIKSALLSQVVAAASVVQSKTSDIRLKRDVECVGAAPNGLPLYTFRYLWSDAVYQGVMAQDVLKVFPEAVS
ncbi:tail fiber domain-containing protein, partial [Mesorhizobium marinum]|uniref:tail fiber domain-containing protein n=1 Tax=Mesorhizobium marinum TaxID=3228790 RepID=UPI0034678858